MLFSLAHADVVHADPAVLDAAPVGAVNFELCQNLNFIACAQAADCFVAGAGAAADIDVVAGDNTGACTVSFGAIDVNIVQRDPALVGAAPTVDLLQNIDACAGCIAADTAVTGAGAAADVQALAQDDALAVLAPLSPFL